MDRKKMNTPTNVSFIGKVKSHAQVSDQTGFVLILFSVLMLVIVGIVALVVDHSRLSLSLDTMQRAADAAALSGARRFNGKVEGWRDAKKAAVLALKENSILGVNPQQRAEIALTYGPSAFDQANSIHTGSSGRSGKLAVTVERGVLWHDYRLTSPASEEHPEGKQGGYRFVSLEGSTPDDMPIPEAVEGFLYSNAVRVTLKLDSLSTSFGKVFGVLGFHSLEKTAIAVTHEDLEVHIAPVAIPLCALRQSIDPYAEANSMELDHIDYRASCARQGIGAEADPKRELPAFRGTALEQLSNDEIIRRREGLTRFESYIRPLYAYYDPAQGVSVCYSGTKPGFKHNCKTIPLWGILGVPSPIPGQEASAHQVAEAFEGGITAAPGMYWSALQSLKGFKINPSLADVVAKSIQETPVQNHSNFVTTFYDQFTEQLTADAPQRVARREFPFIRNQRPSCGAPGSDDDVFDPERRPCLEDDPSTPLLNEADPYHDLRISWPTAYEIEGEPVMGRILMDRRSNDVSRQPLDYTNPLCHHPSIPIDSVNSGGDPRRHKVRRTLAAVISPGVKFRDDGRPVVYCDAEGMFTGYNTELGLSSVAPVPESAPVIQGFIPITVYDAGLQDLDSNPRFQPEGRVSPLSYRLHSAERQRTFRDTTTSPPNGWQRVVTPHYTDPTSGEVIVDRNTGELDVLGNYFTNRAKGYINQFEEEHEEWEECVENTETSCSNSKAQAPGGDYLGIPEEYLQCFDFRPVFANPQFGNVVQSLNAIEPDTCTEVVGVVTRSYPCISQAQAKADALFNVLQNHFNENIPALPYSHCLPRKDIAANLNIHDKNNPDYYIQPIDTTRAGFGCGGVLFKTSCGTEDGLKENTIFLPAGINWDATSPALMAEDSE